MATLSARAVARFYELMQRVRALGLGDQPAGGAQLSPAQRALLDAIQAAPGAGVNEIAAALHLSPPTVSVGVRRLERSGLLERRPHPQDRRARRLFLTRRGRALQRHIHDAHQRKFRRLLAGLTAREQQTLLDLLERAVRSSVDDPLREVAGAPRGRAQS